MHAVVMLDECILARYVQSHTLSERSLRSLPARAFRRVDLPAPGGPSSSVRQPCHSTYLVDLLQGMWMQSAAHKPAHAAHHEQTDHSSVNVCL